MLEIADIEVRFGDFTLGPVSSTVADGEFVSLMGTNGSGKSTLIRAILGLQAHRGTARVDGFALADRERSALLGIGYVSDSSDDVLAEFTATEYWNYCLLARGAIGRAARDEGMERAREHAGKLMFPVDSTRPMSALSLGTVRKAQIVAALLGAPTLLVMDEPFIGLDFIAARALEALLRELSADGMSVLASSHDLDLASRIATRCLVLDRGRLVLDEAVAALGGAASLESAVWAALADRGEPR